MQIAQTSLPSWLVRLSEIRMIPIIGTLLTTVARQNRTANYTSSNTNHTNNQYESTASVVIVRKGIDLTRSACAQVHFLFPNGDGSTTFFGAIGEAGLKEKSPPLLLLWARV